MAQVFFSYSHEDEALRDRLEKHLALLRRQGLIEAWHDRRIESGSEFDPAISAQLEQAEVILLLVSVSFMASEYCYSREMMRAMERHESGAAVVIPVILAPCEWHQAPFGKLLAAPRDGKPVVLWPNHDEAFTDVVGRIRPVVERIHAKGATSPKLNADRVVVALSATPAPAGTLAARRSSNLRLKKEFTDRDRDLFLQNTFEYVARFFADSLSELEKRNPGVETNYRRIDANTFTATIYRFGSAASQCAVSVGGSFSRSITYSSDVNSRGNSYNEALSVEVDEQGMFLSTLGMNHGSRSDHLSDEGAAEHLWAMLIRALQ